MSLVKENKNKKNEDNTNDAIEKKKKKKKPESVWPASNRFVSRFVSRNIPWSLATKSH